MFVDDHDRRGRGGADDVDREAGYEDWNKEDIDWDAIDSQLVSHRIVITRSEINGKRLGALRLRNQYGINITRIYRAGIVLLPTPDLTLQLGDRLTVVGGGIGHRKGGERGGECREGFG